MPLAQAQKLLGTACHHATESEVNYIAINLLSVNIPSGLALCDGLIMNRGAMLAPKEKKTVNRRGCREAKTSKENLIKGDLNGCVPELKL